MAGVNVTKNKTYHGTLTAATIDYVTIQTPSQQVTVVNRTAATAAEIYFTVDGQTNPTVKGDNTYVVPAGIFALSVDLPQANQTNITFSATGQSAASTGAFMVQLISSGTPEYSVEVI